MLKTMIIHLENYDSFAKNLEENWLRAKKKEIGTIVDSFQHNYKENQVLNILGRVNCIENSLK